MEGAQQILFHRILQADLVCDLMIEDFVNVPAFQIVVSFIRRCGHTKPQLWFKIVQDFFVAVGGAVVGFIDYDYIKCILLIPVQILLFAQSLLFSSKSRILFSKSDNCVLFSAIDLISFIRLSA